MCLLTSDPVASYNESKKNQASAANEVKLEDLSQAQRDWLRAT